MLILSQNTFIAAICTVVVDPVVIISSRYLPLLAPFPP